MAKGRKKGSKRPQKKLSLAGTIGFAGTLAKGIYEPITQTTDNNIRLAKITRNFTGYNYITKKWEFADMAATYGPAVVGGLVAMAGKKLRLNRYMPNIPFVKVF